MLTFLLTSSPANEAIFQRWNPERQSSKCTVNTYIVFGQMGPVQPEGLVESAKEQRPRELGIAHDICVKKKQ